ncbi:MAG: DUF305 domain-containing protein [Limnobacter sp.]|nr:DUF305 domain-containing protein [Limnobacter sp.]
MLNQKEIKRLRVICHVPLLALCLSSAAWAQNMTPNPATTMPASKAATQGAKEQQDMKNSMMTNHMDKMNQMTMSGDVDKDFASMMKMHHQHGVEMAQMHLKNGKSPEMKKMAKQIIASQNKEISQIDAWLSKQK